MDASSKPNPNQPKLEDCVLVPVKADDDTERKCDLCVRVYDRSGLYGPACRRNGWDCGYKGTHDTSEEWMAKPKVWMTKLNAVVYLLTGEVNDG